MKVKIPRKMSEVDYDSLMDKIKLLLQDLDELDDVWIGIGTEIEV